MSIYDRLGFTPDEIHAAARRTYDELIDFATTPAFRAVVEDLESVPEFTRPDRVWEVLMDEAELARRGVEIPDGVLIQRSTFGDRRPTLFCIKKYLPERFHAVIQNVNITFDNPHREHIPDDEKAWREPLPVEIQSLAMGAEEELQSISDSVGVSMVDSNPYEKVDLIRGEVVEA